jgi:two-component system chemotaxis response regulator CheB
MSVALDETLTRALASALRSLEERIAVVQKLESQTRKHGSEAVARAWAEKVQDLEKEASVIRDSIRRTEAIAARAAQGAK